MYPGVFQYRRPVNSYVYMSYTDTNIHTPYNHVKSRTYIIKQGAKKTWTSLTSSRQFSVGCQDKMIGERDQQEQVRQRKNGNIAAGFRTQKVIRLFFFVFFGGHHLNPKPPGPKPTSNH